MENTPSPIEVAASWQTKIFVTSIIFAVVAAVVGAIFAVLLFNAGNAYQAAVKNEAEANIALANKEAAKASEATEKLKIEVAEAKQKQAEAERQLLELKERLRPRALNPHQKTKLLQKVKNLSIPNITIGYLASDEESKAYALELAEVFREGGCKTATAAHITTDQVTGVCFISAKAADVDTLELLQALCSCNIKLAFISKEGVEKYANKQGFPTILVGTKNLQI